MNYDNGYSLSDIASVIRNNDNSGFGEGNSWWVILFIIILFGGWGNRGFGFGGYGNGGTNGSTSVYEGYVLNNDFSQLSKQISDTYNMTDRKFEGISNGLCSGFYQEAQLINQTNSNIANAQYNLANAITTNGYETRNAITQDTIANMQNTNAIATQISNCCCDLKSISKDNRYENLQNINMLNNSINNGFVSVNQANCLNTRDIIASQEAGTRAVLQALNDDKLERKNEQIQAQQNEINALRLCASQERQNNYLVEKLQYPKIPVPSYTVANPYCNCNCNNNCGCGM